jgi:hypothetical protein
MLLGGITGTIDSIGTETGNDGVRKKLGQPSLRREQALRALLCEGRSIDEIAADRGIQARSLHLSFPRDLCALGVSKLMVPALLNGSPSQLRAAVAHLLGLTDRRQGWSDEWLEAVRAAYISGRLDRWFKSWQPAVSDERQRLNRLLVDSGGIVNLKEATVLHGFPASSLRTFASLSGSHPATVSILDDRIGRGSGVLRLRVCQCCGSPLSLILRVPESAVFSSALLCENCRTLGVKGSPVFPDFYFDLWLPENRESQGRKCQPKCPTRGLDELMQRSSRIRRASDESVRPVRSTDERRNEYGRVFRPRWPNPQGLVYRSSIWMTRGYQGLAWRTQRIGQLAADKQCGEIQSVSSRRFRRLPPSVLTRQ